MNIHLGRAVALASLLCTAPIGGCQTVPQFISERAKPGEYARAFTYYLPKAVLTLQYTRVAADIKDETGLLSTLTTQLDAAYDARDTQQANLDVANRHLIALRQGTPEEVAARKNDIDKYELQARDAESLRDAARMKAARIKQRIELVNRSIALATRTPEGRETITMPAAPSYQPDPSLRFLTDFSPSSFWTVAGEISTSKNGLLQTGNSTVSDKSSDILLQGVKLGGNVAKAGAGYSTLGLDDGATSQGFLAEADTRCGRAITITAIVSPSDLSSFEAFNNQLEQECSTLRVSCPDCAVAAAAPRPYIPSREDGIAYRRNLPIRIDVRRGERGPVIQAISVEVPDFSPIDFTDGRTGRGTTVKNEYTFEDGMLKKLITDRPSEVLAIATIPNTLLEEAIKIPKDILTLRYNNVNERQKITTAEKALLDAQAELLKAREALERAKAEEAEKKRQ